MNQIYKDVITKHAIRGTIIRIYMDNIAIATSTSLPDHIAAVKDVLTVAQNHDLYFKPEKCTFHAPSIDYLGVILEKGITRMDPTKVAGIKNWPTVTFRTFLSRLLTAYHWDCRHFFLSLTLYPARFLSASCVLLIWPHDSVTQDL